MRQPIRPGDVNWMIAGRGIVHSERTPQALRAAGSSAWGLQCWLALPQREEERSPSFTHHGKDEFPCGAEKGTELRIVAGGFLGMRSPVPMLSECFYADAMLAAGTELAIPAEYEERGAYIVDGRIAVDGQSFERGQLLVFKPGMQAVVSAVAAARLVLLGGEPLGARYLWWNFVSSSRERIEQAKEALRAAAADDGESLLAQVLVAQRIALAADLLPLELLFQRAVERRAVGSAPVPELLPVDLEHEGVPAGHAVALVGLRRRAGGAAGEQARKRERARPHLHFSLSSRVSSRAASAAVRAMMRSMVACTCASTAAGLVG